jgi:hypothetical protein
MSFNARTVQGDLFPAEVPDFLMRGESLFDEVREAKPQIPRQILNFSPLLNEAVKILFSEGNPFDEYAHAHGEHYHFTVTVDVDVQDGHVKTADLEKFGLHYEGETVSKQVLLKDLILPRKLTTEADWTVLSRYPNNPNITVRLAPHSSMNSTEHLMARMIYGLYKVMWRNDLKSLEKVELPYESKVQAREQYRLDFKGAVESCLHKYGVLGKLDFDPTPAPSNLTERFFRAYSQYCRDPETAALQEIIKWGQQNSHLPEVQKLYQVVKELGIIS